MPEALPQLETRRQAAQLAWEAGASAAERNRLGQFATPAPLAQTLLRLGLEQLPADQPLRFLDPALGSGAFFSALLSELGERPLASALGLERDETLAGLARDLWAPLGLEVRCEDSTLLELPPAQRADLLVCNPPYVRHHHIPGPEKRALARRVQEVTGLAPSGLAGLYCGFLMLSRAWMQPKGVAVWLVPGEFMDVGYGGPVRRFLLEQLTLLRVHRSNPRDPQFPDALVSSAILVLRNEPPPPGHRVRFTWGGRLEEPARTRELAMEQLARAPRWTRLTSADAAEPLDGPALGALFKVSRGVATGANAVFILDEAQVQALGVPPELRVPILPPPRRLKVDRVQARADGSPDLAERLFLLRCSMTEDELRDKHPALWRYLEDAAPALADRYLCRKREPWYTQEQREPAPLLCTYMGSDQRRPFRFVLNRSQALASNAYLMLYPRPNLAQAMAQDPGLLEHIWQALNTLDPAQLTQEGRVYGGGLHKLEPSELLSVRLPGGLVPLGLDGEQVGA